MTDPTNRGCFNCGYPIVDDVPCRFCDPDLINLTQLRADVVLEYQDETCPHCGTKGRDLLALINTAEAAQEFFDLDYGYLNEATKQGLDRLRETLTRYQP